MSKTHQKTQRSRRLKSIFNSLKIIFFFCLLAFAACRVQTNQRGTVIDLAKRLPYAKKSDDSQIILFGTSEAKQFLLSGWSRPGKDGNETIQSAASNKTAFIFKRSKIEPLFLHMKLGSFFANSAQILLNSRPFATIHVGDKPKLYSLQLPVEAMHPDTNVVEFDWNELRKLSKRKNSPELAAVAYFAVISPAKYLSGNPATNLQALGPALLQVAGKTRASITFPLGGSVRYYEKLNKDSRLEFGIFYDPPALSEKDDFADFSITLRRDGQPDQRVFQKRAVQEMTSHEMIPLSKYITTVEPQVCEIEFKVHRNSILDTGKSAWIEPVLYQGFSEQNQISNDAIGKIRRANERANVIIILLDAAGAKHLPTYGYHRKTTPNIEKLFQEGIQFEKAYCQAVYTLASTASLMTGLDPYRHQVYDRQNKLPAEAYTLAERFLNAGYVTATFVANGNVSPNFGTTQGFQVIREVHNEPYYTGWASDITNRFTQWLQSLEPERNFFVYLHYREPHGPFNPPESFKHHFTDPNYTRFKDASDDMRRRIQTGEIVTTQADLDFITAAYDENLRYGDYEVGRVIQKLKDLKLYDRTIIIITADHGEAFWEHDFQGHNSQLYEESVHIPLILKLSSNTGFHGKRVKTPVRTIDVYPSLVDLLQLSRQNWNVDGRSFIPDLVSEKPKNVPIFSQTLSEQAFSYTEGNFKYIYHRLTGAEELYDLKADPEERNNLIKTQLIEAAYLRSRLFGWHTESRKAGALVQNR